VDWRRGLLQARFSGCWTVSMSCRPLRHVKRLCRCWKRQLENGSNASSFSPAGHYLYEPKAIPIEFEKVGIDHWTESDIRSFVQAWTRLLYPNANEEKRRLQWGTLLATIMGRPDLQSLARNAVMVTAMAVVHHNETRLPEGRARPF